MMSRRPLAALLPLILGVCSLAPSARADDPPAAARVFDLRVLEEADRALTAAELPDRWSEMAVVASAAASKGISAARVRDWLGRGLAPCLRSSQCEELYKADEKAGGIADKLLSLLGELGSSADFPLLMQLEKRGNYRSGVVRYRLLSRSMAEAIASSRCQPPSDAEIASARADLGDFLAIRSARAGLVAEAPSARELDDLAYFMASITDAGPEVGTVEEGVNANVVRLPGAPTQPDPKREAFLSDIEKSRLAGDVAGLAAAARGYLTTFGFPGKLRADEEDEYAWGGARFSFVMRDLAEADESLGKVRDAATLYRRANPGGGMCGTSYESMRMGQIVGVIRSEERSGRCRAAVPERLMAIDESDGKYGPDRLAAAGFDVARLYRGALVTMNREAEPAALRAAISAAPATVRARALARLDKRGAEAWEMRVHAAEGLVDTGQRAAIRPALDALAMGSTSVRVRAITALGELAAKPENDPCDPKLFGGSHSWKSEYHREVRALGRSCATKLPDPAAAALAARLLPYASDPDPPTRAAAAEALGNIAQPLAGPTLLRLLDDPFSPDGISECITTTNAQGTKQERCNPTFPVREAATKAIEAMGGKDAARAPHLAGPSRLRGAARL